VSAPGDYDNGEIGGMIGRGTEVLGENLPQCRFVNNKAHMLPVREPGPPRWEASVYPLSYGTALHHAYNNNIYTHEYTNNLLIQ
jgi:hypothetical protein